MSEHSDRCWRTVGAWGDASCPRLASAGHCRRCAVYSAGGRDLFDQPMPAGFREEWTRSLAAVKTPPPSDQVRVLVFRVWADRLALPLAACHEAVKMGPVRTIPLMSGKVLKGLVNIRGELLPCLSVGDLLELDPPADAPGYAWLLVVGSGTERFALPVSEILGVTRVEPERLQPPPATVTKFPETVVRHVFQLDGHAVGLLAGDRFVQALRRSLAR